MTRLACFFRGHDWDATVFVLPDTSRFVEVSGGLLSLCLTCYRCGKVVPA